MASDAPPDPRGEPLTKLGKVYIVRDHFAAIIHVGLLLVSAQTLAWVSAWLFGGLMLAIKTSSALVLTRLNPAVLNARGTKREMSRREKRFFAVLIPASLGLPIVAGLDAGAPGWTHQNLVELGLGLGCALAGGAITIAALAANAFFEPTVRVQSERDHQVCTSGPYRFVRHPGYLGTLLVLASAPLILGSRWAFIPVVIEAIALVVRITYEERMLHEELPGYTEYSEHTRARLVPGIW